MSEMREVMKRRTRKFGADIIRMTPTIPDAPAKRIVIDQLVRSACSVGSNYRAAQRPRSTADMIAKLKIVEEELDEAMYWLEMLVESGMSTKDFLKPSYAEANELLSIVVASIKSLRKRVSQVREDSPAYGASPSDIFDEL